MSWFPFVSRRRYERELFGARAAERWAIDRANDAEAETATARQVQQFQIVKRAEAEAGAKRIAARLRVVRDRSVLLDLEEAYGLLERRHGRLLAACLRYRGRLADQAALIAAQQRQVDAATGLDHPDIQAGAGWQQTRPDKAAPFRGEVAS